MDSRLQRANCSLALIHKDAFIQGMRRGKNLSTIAEELNLDISRQAISRALIDDPDYQAAKEEWHEARIEQAEARVLAAQENVDVTRARVYWQAVTWRAEREYAQRWGQKQQVEHTNAPIINFVMGNAASHSESKAPPITAEFSQVSDS